MVFGFIKSKPPLDDESILWMFDSFAWALRNFDSHAFFHETVLVTPSNEHFPGQEDSAHGKAKLIFEQAKQYAGLKHWPFHLINEEDVVAIEPPQLKLQSSVRGTNATALKIVEDTNPLIVPYNPALLGDPQVLIATYAHSLAHYLASMTQEVPPGGIENWPHVTELLSVFLGFGLIMANTAFTKKIRSCGSCSGPSIERTNFLSQYDITYGLAIFCRLKGIPNKDVLRHLKSTLHTFYKKSANDVNSRADELGKLKA